MPLMSPTKPRQMTDRLMALNILGMAKAGTQALCAAELGANNPDLKRLYRNYLQEMLLGVEALETYTVDQEWRKPFANPEEQLQTAIQDADALISVKA